MTVEINVERKAVEITWDEDIVEGETVTIRSTNSDNPADVSVREAQNDGRATVTYPADYTGSTDVVVTGSESGEDTGTITV